MEGILPSSDYGALFDTALKEYGRENIFAYYYDISLEETLRRHQTKPNRDDFGEEDMRRWWQEKDYLENIKEDILGEDISLPGAVEKIYREVFAGNP